MQLTIGMIVTRGSAPGSRPCDCCKQTGRELREITIQGWGFRDACGPCIDRLKRMPRLPDKGKDAAWEKALAELRGGPSGASSRGSSPAEGSNGPPHL